jgi:hypothetical protein
VLDVVNGRYGLQIPTAMTPWDGKTILKSVNPCDSTPLSSGTDQQILADWLERLIHKGAGGAWYQFQNVSPVP